MEKAPGRERYPFIESGTRNRELELPAAGWGDYDCCAFSDPPQSGRVWQCREFLILFRVGSLVPHEAGGFVLAMHFHQKGILTSDRPRPSTLPILIAIVDSHRIAAFAASLCPPRTLCCSERGRSLVGGLKSDLLRLLSSRGIPRSIPEGEPFGFCRFERHRREKVRFLSGSLRAIP